MISQIIKFVEFIVRSGVTGKTGKTKDA